VEVGELVVRNPLDTLGHPRNLRSAAMLDPALAAAVADKLKSRNETVAVAEGSCGGLISAALLAIPGASKYFVGGSVIYTRTAKEALYPDIETAKGMRGATEAWATWLATAARARMGTTWGIGEGGAAGPANPYGDPAGHAWFAVAGPDGVRTKHVLTGIDDRANNMVEFTKAAIALLDECLGENENGDG
jgi:PncC family amidohydrolase